MVNFYEKALKNASDLIGRCHATELNSRLIGSKGVSPSSLLRVLCRRSFFGIFPLLCQIVRLFFTICVIIFSNCVIIKIIAQNSTFLKILCDYKNNPKNNPNFFYNHTRFFIITQDPQK